LVNIFIDLILIFWGLKYFLLNKNQLFRDVPASDGGCSINGYILYVKVLDANDNPEILLYDGSANLSVLNFEFNYINNIVACKDKLLFFSKIKTI